LTSFRGRCKEKGCSWYEKAEFADYRAWFGHYWRKGRNTLIELVQENKILKNAHIEPTYILADKLVKISKIEENNETNETRCV